MERLLGERVSPSSLSADYTAVLIPTDGIDRIWHVAAPLLEKATKRTTKIDLASLYAEAKNDHMQIWLVYETSSGSVDAAVATEIVTYTSGVKSARILLLGGLHVNRWKHCIATIEDWASNEDCSTVEIVGRRGWGRVYDGDYRPSEYWFAKEI